MILRKYGLEGDSPKTMQGDRVCLFESEDLTKRLHKGVSYEHNPAWMEHDEDNMGPSFLPLPSSPDGGRPRGKYLRLFISHKRGCQYYLGDYDETNDRFVPTNHGRMSWVDNTNCASESLIEDRRRQIMWATLNDNTSLDKVKTQGYLVCRVLCGSATTVYSVCGQ